MVHEGDFLEVTRQEELSCNVLFYKDDGQTLVGTPLLETVFVELERIEDKKDQKVVVARFKSKSRYRKKKGHRQPISVIKIKSISLKEGVQKKTTQEKEPEKTLKTAVAVKTPKKRVIKKKEKVN